MENTDKMNTFYKEEIENDLVHLMGKFYSDYVGKIETVKLKENSKLYVVLEHFLRPEVAYSHNSHSYSYTSQIAITTLFKADSIEDLYCQVKEYRFLDIPPKPINCPELTNAYAKVYKNYLKQFYKEFGGTLFRTELIKE